ncbi:MAG: STAS domain-containing protein [SAR324 cluster bacterium]|nr:STAS domain-containing protein [SAR324 cluster bacterium]
MEITHRIENKTCIFTFDSAFVAADIETIRNYVQPFIEDHAIDNFLFNFKSVSNIDSTGIGFLMETRKNLDDRHARLTFCETNEYVDDIFDITNIDTMVSLYSSEKEALANLI